MLLSTAPHVASTQPTSIPYLPAAQTGTSWLFDPARMPRQEEWLEPDARVDAAALARDVRLVPSLVADTFAWAGKRSYTDDSIKVIAERNAQRIERSAAADGTVVASEAISPLWRDMFAKYDEQHMWFSVAGAGPNLRRDADLMTREFRGPADALKAAATLPGAIARTAEVVTRSGPTGSGRIGSLAVKGVEALNQFEQLGYTPLIDAVEGAKAVSDKLEPAYTFDMVDDVAVIRIARLAGGPGSLKQLRQFVADAPRHRQARSIMIDMRGNGGGNDGYITDWATQLRREGTELPWPTRERFTSGRHEKIAAWNTTTSYGNDPEDPNDDSWFEEGQATKKYWPLSRQTPLDPPNDGPNVGVADSDYTGKVVVLVDRWSASSAESGSIFLRDWLGATIVGERTGGAVEGANVITYPLPNTGIGLALPSRQSHWKDQRVRESAGIPIDVALDNPSASVQELLPQLHPWLAPTR